MRPSRIVVALVGLAVVLATACTRSDDPAVRAGGSAPASPFPVTLTDDEGVVVTLDEEPDRIVTFAPSHTEIVYALDAGDRLAGVSGPFDDFPPEAQELPTVAGASGIQPNAEKVVSLETDVVLTAFIGGEWKDRLRDLGVPVFTTLASDLPDAIVDIVTIGRLIGAGGEAEALATAMEQEVDEIQPDVAEERPTCFLELSDLFTVGPGSLEYDLLQRAGCDPVTASAGQPYPQWSVEQLVEDDPAFFFASETGQPIEEIVDRPGVRDLTAVKEGRVAVVSGDLISRPGPRIVDGLRELAEALRG